LSPPGSGKSSIAAQLAAQLGYVFAPLELGLTVAEEVGGVPARDHVSGSIVRFPLAPIKAACDAPAVQLIDEVTRADASRQGAAMTGINERRWGDACLHPRTVIVLAGNEPDSGGVFSLLDALLNRCCVVRLRTTRAETCAYLRTLGAPGTALNYYASAYADFAEVRAEMIAEEPPPGFSESGALWPSGRAIEHAMERIAARVTRGGLATDGVSLTTVQGILGRETGVLWHRISELQGKLPTAAEIEAAPDSARLPTDTESAIAVLPAVRTLTSRATWLYLARFPAQLAEVQAAGVRANMSKSTGMPPGSPELKAFTTLVGRVSSALAATR
jgi:hypothetical protein